MTIKKKNDFKPIIDPIKREGEFRLNAIHCFLTFPRFSCNPQDLWNFINSKYEIKKSLIATETHEDGQLHMHAYVNFKKKIDIRKWDIFDFKGHHCNIQRARKPIACIKYLNKEDLNPHKFGNIIDDEIDDIYEFARETPEEDYFNECRKQKVSIYPLNIGQPFICQSGVEKMHSRYTGREYLLREYCNRRDYYPRDFIAAVSTNRNNKISVDQRPIGCGENNICFETWLETITVYTPSGHSATLQTWIPPNDCLRRHELSTFTTKWTDTVSRYGPSLPNSYKIQSSQHSSQNTEDIFKQ